MKCLKCGAEIDNNSKFCGYCGNPVEQPTVTNIPEEVVQNNNEIQPNNVQVHPMAVNNAFTQNEVITPISVNEQPVQIESEQPIQQINETPVVTQTVEVQPSQVGQDGTTKKKKNTGIFILLGTILILCAAILLIFELKNNSSKSLNTLEKSINNVLEKSQSSGTIVASVLLQTNSNESMNINGTIKFQKLSDSLNIEANLAKSLFFDEVNLYANIKNNNATLYAKSSLVDMILGSTGDTDKWLKETFSDLEIDLSEISSKKIDLSGYGIDKKLKYVETDNNLKHYKLTIDKELLNDINSKLNDKQDETISLADLGLSINFVIDFYINNNNELEKISMDLSDYIADESISKAVLSLEFKDFNNTVVVIPNNALNAEGSLQEYISENIDINSLMGYDMDFDENFIEDIDSSFSFDY